MGNTHGFCTRSPVRIARRHGHDWGCWPCACRDSKDVSGITTGSESYWIYDFRQYWLMHRQFIAARRFAGVGGPCRICAPVQRAARRFRQPGIAAVVLVALTLAFNEVQTPWPWRSRSISLSARHSTTGPSGWISRPPSTTWHSVLAWHVLSGWLDLSPDGLNAGESAGGMSETLSATLPGAGSGSHLGLVAWDHRMARRFLCLKRSDPARAYQRVDRLHFNDTRKHELLFGTAAGHPLGGALRGARCRPIYPITTTSKDPEGPLDGSSRAWPHKALFFGRLLREGRASVRRLGRKSPGGLSFVFLVETSPKLKVPRRT